MPLSLICASHSPLMERGVAPDGTREAVLQKFRHLGDEIRAFKPDLAIQFSPDHFNGFFYDLMPAFCVGAQAESVGDWGTRTGPIDVPTDVSVALFSHLLEEGFDGSLSYRMQVDHGFVQFWEQTIGSIDVPLIPIFVNCAAPPLPTVRRVRQLGAAVGRFAKNTGRRVLIIASGGLSHDPPTPRIAGATPEIRERLIANRNPTAEARAAKEARIVATAHEIAEGKGAGLPVSERWDRWFLEALMQNDEVALDRLTTTAIVEEAGRGGPEVLCWVAAMAAMRQAGDVEPELHYYAAIQGWVAGMAMLTTRESAHRQPATARRMTSGTAVGESE